MLGTIAGGNAAAGTIGEFINNSVAIGSAIALTSGVPANVTSIALTAGDWDVWGLVATNPTTTTTQSQVIGSINTASATNGGITGVGSSITAYSSPSVANEANFINVAPCRINVTVTTTVFLVADCVFAVSTLGAYGSISARRVR